MSQMKERYVLTQSQKMMVFILSMSLYGLSNMITELVPSVNVGPVEFSIEYFAFIPLTLCILFHPLYAAIGASLGEVIFGEIMLGQFGGFGELEKFIGFSLAMFIAGTLVNDPKNKLQVGTAAILGVIIHQAISCTVDIAKVWIGIEELETVPGLAESVVVIEGFSFLNDVLFSGILFALLPTLYLVPRLYGKIEPLLGMKPRNNKTKYSMKELIGPRLIAISILLACSAFLFEYLSEAGFNVEWEADFIGTFGDWFNWVSIAVAAIVAAITIIVMRSKNKNKRSNEDQSERIPS
ncbi:MULTISPECIES: cell division protein FtsQ [Bacillaceae]|uniref:cell division protein FtsQ n=1 Tax=Bacillaceae TaxID=186817 RepID=UPI000BFE631A|nr:MULTISPECIES: cell division protein FtsQ [Bacillaceae]PGT76736.1 cell division protein FtsQ [Bacillus sp. AFS040349]UGB30256.1 cell division protein FtsQ [Metabacillus sp. B2-18]